jgi:acyltransferase
LETNRLNWVDSLKGFAIFLVVYGHNFPFCEKYIYSFHMPLFLMISGFFYPRKSDLNDLKKRFISLIIPYFSWASILFVFWVIIAKKMGVSAQQELSNLKNFIGIFYAQGGGDYMNWGIPMWFLPMLFLAFCLRYFIGLCSENSLVRFIIILLFTMVGYFLEMDLPWSFNVAFVAVFFLFLGEYIFKNINRLSRLNTYFLLVVFLVSHYLMYDQNAKVDMYRSQYGNLILFLLNGFLGSFFLILLFKNFINSSILSFVGKFTIVILAMQTLAMSFIKLAILIFFRSNDFDFSDWQKFVFAILQILILVPFFLIINKYLPILNGGFKKI